MKTALLGLCACLLSSVAHSTTVYCGALLDVRNGTVLKDKSIHIEGEQIQAVSDGRANSVDIDLGEMTCLPGLMDMHTHLTSEISPVSYIEQFQLNPADIAYQAAVFARRTLMAGFTTVRDLGDSDNVSIALRRAIEKGYTVGPRIFTAATALGTTGGHADPTNGRRADLVGEPGPTDGVVNGADDIRRAVRQRYKDGANLIKITATGGVLSVAKNGENPQFTEEEIEVVVSTAKDYGFHVAAHAHGAEGMKRAVRAGVRSIEHGTLMDEETMRLMKRHGTYYVPTILAGEFVAEKAKVDGYFPALVRPKAAALGPQIKKTFAKAYKAGVKIAFGTDSGVSAHGDNAQEFALMVAQGMPAMEAIQSATIATAELLGISDQLGSVEAGKIADIIAVSADPLASVASLEEVAFVMKAGTVYKAP